MSRHFVNLKVWLAGVMVFATAGASTGVGQAAAAVSPPQTVEDALHQLSDAAGVIFAGQVMLVHPVAGSGGAGGVVAVTFRVDQAVKGCTAGGTYVLREWAGLWNGDDARYRVGQRLLMLVRTPSAGGMSSPVGGMDGAGTDHRGGDGDCDGPIHGWSNERGTDDSGSGYGRLEMGGGADVAGRALHDNAGGNHCKRCQRGGPRERGERDEWDRCEQFGAGGRSVSGHGDGDAKQLGGRACCAVTRRQDR